MSNENESTKQVPLETLVSGVWKEWNKELPKKGEDIEVVDVDGEKRKWLFRCSCPNPKCTELRDMGGAILITPRVWRYH